MSIPEPEVKIELGSPLWIPKKRTTVLAAIVATISSFCLGNVLGWSAPALFDIKKEKYFGDLNDTQEGYAASFAILGALLSAPFTAYSMGAIGRKPTMLIIAIPFAIGWGMIAWAVNLPMLYAGRFVTGFCGGASTVVVPAYVSEITEEKIRGTLATIMILMLVTGVEFTLVVGAFLSYQMLSIVCGCIPIAFFISMLFMPESPRYLLTQGKSQKAGKALEWLRRASKKQYIEPELTEIENSIEDSNGQSKKWKDLLISNVMKPTGICTALFIFQQCSGVNGVSFFAVKVFESAGTSLDPKVGAIILGACQLLTVLFVPIILVDKVPRKVLMVSSQLIMTGSLLALGTYYHIKEQNGDKPPEYLSWLPLTSFIAFYIGYNVGMGPLPWLVMSEILPNHIKGRATSIVTAIYWICSYLSAQLFPTMAEVLGWSVLWWLSAVVCIGGTIFIVMAVPETKNKSSSEIQKLFLTKRQSLKLAATQENKGVDNAVFTL